MGPPPAISSQVVWPPEAGGAAGGEERSKLPPPPRAGPPARSYPFALDPFQQTAVNCLEAGEGGGGEGCMMYGMNCSVSCL